MPTLSDRERAVRLRLRDDFEHYAAKCLRIRTKLGAVEPFALNKAQRYIHGRLQAQLAESGRVRALILKGRQQGASTYVGGRFYWRSTHRWGVRVQILTHLDEATQNLFAMVARYHEHCPDLVKPETGKSNEKELTFPRLDSGYKVSTAKTKGTGRSSTSQLFHGSEVGFWPHAETHLAGVLQAVPDAPGTEVILESTANGVGNVFHQMWRDAEAGIGDFIGIFVPWFWQDEYTRPVPPDFTLSTDRDETGESEADYAEAYGLTLPQMAWRREKIRQLGDITLFRQEYPATPAEAFQNAGHDSFIRPALVVAARKRAVEASGPLVIGFDPAWMGGDRHAMAWRRGRKLIKVEAKVGLDTVASAGWAKSVLDVEKPARMFVDATGVGAGVYDQLVSMGYGPKGSGQVVAVNFGASPIEPPRIDPSTGQELPGPLNRRAEIWLHSRDWLEDPAGVDIPDLDELQADACGPSYSYDARTRIRLEDKDAMRRRGVKSPDYWDAVALTFALPVVDKAPKKPAARRPRLGFMAG